MQLAFRKTNRLQNLINLTAKFQLRHQLSSYGLNPEDWRYELFEIGETSGQAQLSHRADPNLLIKGHIIKEVFRSCSPIKFKWESLSWDL